MGHPLLDEFCRVHSQDSLRPDFFRRCQRVFRDEIQPQLDEREQLLAENARLIAQLEIYATDQGPESENDRDQHSPRNPGRPAARTSGRDRALDGVRREKETETLTPR